MNGDNYREVWIALEKLRLAVSDLLDYDLADLQHQGAAFHVSVLQQELRNAETVLARVPGPTVHLIFDMNGSTDG